MSHAFIIKRSRNLTLCCQQWNPKHPDYNGGKKKSASREVVKTVVPKKDDNGKKKVHKSESKNKKLDLKSK